MPNPNSALSSSNEFAHAGPRPSLFTQYGVVGKFPPYIEEQPVALAMINLSPNICVNNLTYCASPQPAHAPENSNNGCLNCVDFISVPIDFGSGTGSFEKNL